MSNKLSPYMLAAIVLVGAQNIAHLFPKPKPPRIFTSADDVRKAKHRKSASEEQQGAQPSKETQHER